MKKLLLLSLILSFGFFGLSQERSHIPNSLKNISKQATFVYATDEVVDVGFAQNPYVSNDREIINEEEVGNTWYDLQTNIMLSNRIHVYPDGAVGAVWTRGIDGPPNFPGRGTGYNYYDGSVWLDQPTERVEDERTGWPSYAPLGENGEIIIAHLASGLKISTREEKGTGDWSFQSLDGPTDLTWPRMITAGESNNSIHLIVNSYDPYGGQPRALFYYRSIDAGATWDIEAEVLEGTGPDYYTEINADSYVWAEENGGAIAFLVGGAWNDMFMMKSTDNGDSWEKTVIWEHPYPMFDWEATIADTFYCVDNSASITLDNEGMAHVTFGINRVMHLDLGTTYNYFPFVDGVGYWNETMPVFSNDLHALDPDTDHPDSELVEDYNLIGWTQDVNGNGEIDFITWDVELFQSYRELGVSTMPSISSSMGSGVYVVFSSTTEGFDNGVCNYKHIWMRTRNEDGSWNEFEDINQSPSHMFDECIYPVFGQNIDEILYILYMADFIPGLAFDEDQEYDNNRMIVVAYDPVGIDEHEGVITEFTVSQNTPNPAVNSTSIETVTETHGIINMRISNMLGQIVHEESVRNSGSSHNFTLDVSSLEPGIYFYTIEIGDGSVTKKMIVQ